MKTTPRLLLATRTVAMLVFLLLFIFATSVVFSQAKVVKDINKAEYRHFNEYSQLTNAQGVFYFVSNDKELWKSDGTTSGTKRVRMVRGIQNLTLMGNVLYFGSTTKSGAELWKSDGTYAGTMRVKQIRKGSNSSAPKSFTNVNGTVYFVADNGTGNELWKTNGTLSGTVLVKDVSRGPEGSEPTYLTVINDMLYFSADDGVHGRELWKSDGTAAGTVMVKDIETDEDSSSEPMELVTMNGFLFFSANTSISGRELWRSDGTANGTKLLNDINPGAASAEIGSIRRMGNAIYFNATTATIGTSLWRSSGTTAGTAMLKDLTSDESEFQVFDMTVLNNRIYWLQAGGPYSYAGHEVWVSNGTAAGTRLVTTFERWHTPARFTFMNNKVFYFSGYWEVEETYGPFQQLCSINPDGSGWSEVWKMEIPFNVAGGDEDQYYYLLEIIAFNNALFFPGVRNDVEGYRLLKSNGSDTAPSALIDTYKPTKSSSLTAMVKGSSGVYFLAQLNPWNDQQLWHTDGTNKGTVLVSSRPGVSGVVTVNNAAYFVTRGGGLGAELWKTNGTPTGTTLLKALDHYPQLVNVAGMLFFYNDAGEVWKSDGTSTGTVLLKRFPGIQHVAASGDIAYMMVTNLSGGQELWKSNGISAATVKVKTMHGPSNINVSATLGNIFYFVGHDGQHGHEVWRTDGTDAGTFMVKDIRTNDNEETIPDIRSITTFNNAIYINAMDVGGQMSLFRSDGTNPGTHEIYDSQQIRQFMPYNDQLLFITQNEYSQTLFSTDGTRAGTKLLRILPANYGWWISHAEVNDILYFGFYGSDVMWRTDGTECGTIGINVGVTKVDNLVAAGDNHILFSGHHNFYGEELFSVNVNALPVPSCPEVSAARQETLTAKQEGDAEHVMYNPNPFDSDLTLFINSDRQSIAEIVVHDIAGQPVTSEVLETNTTYQIGSNWRQGIYIMHIYVDGKVTHERVVKGRQ